jgi:hypothetical protein
VTYSYEHKLAELNELINDMNVPLQPALIWQLAEEISGRLHMMNIDDRKQLVLNNALAADGRSAGVFPPYFRAEL